jgi:hypothetical protein
MNEDGLCASCRNLSPDLGHLIERLPAKSTSEVAKEDQQNRRLIDDLKQRAARLCSILAQDRDQLLLIGELCGCRQNGLDSIAKSGWGMVNRITASVCRLGQVKPFADGCGTKL